MSLRYRLANAADVVRAIRGAGPAHERERWPRERLEAFQRERLGALVEHASTHSPFYHALYGGRIDRRDVDLAALPTVAKATMMERFDDFTTDRRLTRPFLERHLASLGRRDELLLGEYRVMASSGSAGRKGIYVYDRIGWSAVLGCAMRSSRMMGIGPRFPRRTRVANVAAPDAKHMTVRGAASLGNAIVRSLRLSAAEPMSRLVEALARYQPDAIVGYPSALALIALEQLEGRLRIAPATVCTTSEVRTPEMTARIRTAWGIEPFDGLGLTETGVTATDCAEHAGLHVFEDACIFEVVDDRNRPVPPGRRGDKVLVTNLNNLTQPFIRFEVSDLVTLSVDPCACGRTFPRITAIEGRSDDVLELRAVGGSVTRVHPIQMRSALARCAAVTQYQIAQAPDGLDVLLALVRDADPPDVAALVERTLAAVLRDHGVTEVPIRVRVVAAIPREAGAGKLKLVKALPRTAASVPS